MSSNLLRFVGEALTAWLRAFANKLKPKATDAAAAPAPSNTGDDPPAHWLERVRKDAPQLLHPQRTTSERHASRAHSNSRQATITEAVRANPSTGVVQKVATERQAHSPGSTPRPPLTWPSADSKATEENESARLNKPGSSRPTSHAAQQQIPVNTRASSRFTRPITHTLARHKDAPNSEAIADKRIAQPGSEHTGLKFPLRVPRIERKSDLMPNAAAQSSKQTRSFPESPRWPSQQPEAANDIQFPISARATPTQRAHFPEFSRRPAPQSAFKTHGSVREEIAPAPVAFPPDAQEDHWPALPIEADSTNPAQAAVAELAHLHRLDLEQKGKLWTA